MQKKLFFIIILAIFSTINLNAQKDSTFWKQVKYGGGLGLSFGNGYFNGGISPSAIYEFNNYLAAGIGFNFSYSTLKDNFESTIWGPSVIALYNPIPELQVSAELQQNKIVQHYTDDIYTDKNYWYPALYMGVGYREQNVTIGFQYDVFYNKKKSIYAEAWMPFVRVYF